MTSQQDRNDLVRQEVVNEVLAHHEGLDHDGVARALARGFLARGLPLPPDPWLDAAATDLVHGRKFVVSSATRAAARSAPAEPPGEGTGPQG